MNAPHVAPRVGRHKAGSRALLASILLLGFFLPSAGSAQSASDKRDAVPGAALDEQVAKTHASIRQVAASAACTNGSATLGVAISGSLSSTDCASTDSNGTLYADFYAFTASAGHTLTVSAHSALSYLATIQDFSSGTVLASTDNCGFQQDNCSFTYVVPSSGTYLLGFGAYGFGSYTITATDSSPHPPPSCGVTTLCLNGSQFRVTVNWATLAGATGSGTALPLSGDTGYFWFFSSANVELVVKVLDGRGVNGHYWVFYGALSNVQYTITVTNTATGAVRIYTNPQGSLASVADTEAF